MSFEAETTIRHLTVRCAGDAASDSRVGLKLRLERLLRPVRLQPAGMPSQAVLLVRNLPGQKPLSGATTFLQPAWLDSVQAQLTTLYRAAARPALGPPPPSAESVLFADSSELLACFTRDILTSQVKQRWYWQPWLAKVGPRPPGTMLATIWQEQARFIPKALGQLTIQENSAAVALFNLTEVSLIVRALQAGFDLPPTLLATSVSDSRTTASMRSNRGRGVDGNGRAEAAAQFDQPEAEPPPPVRPPPPSPWVRWLAPTDARSLTPQAHCLLGLGLALCHAPAFARSETFAAQASTWLQSALIHRQHEARPMVVKSSSENSVEPSVTDQSLKILPPLIAHRGAVAGEIPQRSQAVSPQVKAEQPVADPAHSAARRRAAAPTPAEPNPSISHPDRNNTPDENVATLSPRAGPTDVSQTGPGLLPAEGVSTGLGGALYLIHLLRRLGLPAAWQTDPLAESLSGWAVIEALSRGLLGESVRRYAEDPIWPVLASLDGRAADAPIGADLPQPEAFRLPARWLQQTTLYARKYPENWVVEESGGRLLVINAQAGYVVADMPLEGRPAAAVLAVLASLYRAGGVDSSWRWESIPPLDPLPSAVSAVMSPALDWWLARVLGFVRHLLAELLSQPAIDPDELAQIILCKQGQLLVSRTHLDLTMSMDEISIPLRRAGFDSNPGWAPDLGYIIQFYFV